MARAVGGHVRRASQRRRQGVGVGLAVVVATACDADADGAGWIDGAPVGGDEPALDAQAASERPAAMARAQIRFMPGLLNLPGPREA
jgi:hypothetical protein